MRLTIAVLSITLLLGLSVAAHAQTACAPRHLSTTDWATDFCQTSVDLNEIMSGGPGKDGIPAITDPAMESVPEAAAWLVEQSPVIAVVIEGEARAYPQALLIWHEIANDTVGGVPVAVTFCPLCNSSIVFDRRVDDDVLEFGVSGNLRRSDMVMYDRQTDSWWQQFTGEGIVGAYTGTLLEIVPSFVMGFGQFAQRYPDGQVMSRETGYNRSYGSNPYAGYDSSSIPFLYREALDERQPALARVLGAVVEETAIAYPLSILQAERLIHDRVGETPVVAFWQPGVVSALDAAIIDESADIGTAALFSPVLDGQTLTFTYSDGTIQDVETGSTWSPFGEATAGDYAGAQLTPIVAGLHFWFAWAAFYPETRIYEPS